MSAWKSIFILLLGAMPSYAALSSLSLDLPPSIAPASRFTQPLNLNQTPIPVKTNRIHFTQSVDVSNYQFVQPVSFDLSQFEKDFTLSELSFAKTISFNWVTFLGLTHFYRIKMDGEGQFYFTYFKQPVIFNKISCNHDCVFMHSRFSEAKFLHSTFNRILSFNYTHAKELLFENIQFEGEIKMSHMVIGNLIFNNSFLFGGLNLSHTKFGGKIAFINTEIFNYLDLSYIEMANAPLDLTMIKITDNSERIKLNLMGADIEKIKLNYLYFKLHFPREASRAEIDDIYSRLLKNFKQGGDISSYKLLLAEYRHNSNIMDKNYFTDLMAKYWWNYSTNPEWIFYWMLVLIIIYTIINTIFYEPLSTYYFDIPFLATTIRPYFIKNNLILRFVYVFPRALLFTFLMFFGTQFRMRNGLREFKSTNIFVNLYFILIIITGMLCMFFLLRYLFALVSS